ncbi:unnamed protein product, partial [marine sediment metagenome]
PIKWAAQKPTIGATAILIIEAVRAGLPQPAILL